MLISSDVFCESCIQLQALHFAFRGIGIVDSECASWDCGYQVHKFWENF